MQLAFYFHMLTTMHGQNHIKRNRQLSYQFCRLSANVVRVLTTLAESRQNQHDKHLLLVYSVEILLMIDSGHVRNMQSTLSNKYEEQCISLAFITRIYHDVRSSECQKQLAGISKCSCGLQSLLEYCKILIFCKHGKTKQIITLSIPKTSSTLWKS